MLVDSLSNLRFNLVVDKDINTTQPAPAEPV
jgi:hypothetical protein